MPSLSKPIEFSNPDAVSTVRGGGLPMRGNGVTVFGMMPPSRANSAKDCISRAYPNVPEATRIGLRKRSRFRVTSSGFTPRNLLVNPAHDQQATNGRLASDELQITPPWVRYGVSVSGISRNQMRSQISLIIRRFSDM